METEEERERLFKGGCVEEMVKGLGDYEGEGGVLSGIVVRAFLKRGSPEQVGNLSMYFFIL